MRPHSSLSLILKMYNQKILDQLLLQHSPRLTHPFIEKTLMPHRPHHILLTHPVPNLNHKSKMEHILPLKQRKQQQRTHACGSYRSIQYVGCTNLAWQSIQMRTAPYSLVRERGLFEWKIRRDASLGTHSRASCFCQSTYAYSTLTPRCWSSCTAPSPPSYKFTGIYFPSTWQKWLNKMHIHAKAVRCGQNIHLMIARNVSNMRLRSSLYAPNYLFRHTL